MTLVRCLIRTFLLTFAVGGVLSGAAATAAEPDVSLSVVSDGGVDGLSVTAREVPLRAVLAEMARVARFQLIEVAPTEGTVSVEFKRLPLDQALRRLLSAESFVFVYGAAGEGSSVRLSEVILLGSGTPGEQASLAEAAPGLSDGADVVPATEEPPRVVPRDAEHFNPDGPLEGLLALATHPDPRMRKASLEALTLHDGNERARQTLMDRIRDSDPNIRAAVIGLLGPFIMVWPEAEEVVMTALRDPAARVRQLALRRIWEASSPRLPDALHFGLQDEDPKVRALTAALLRSAPLEGSDQ